MPQFIANFQLSSLDGTNGFKINGEAADDYSGSSVASAGDINGDGFADLIIGASRADPNGSYSGGGSFVVFGKAAGFGTNLELSALNGTDGFQINGELADDNSGRSVASAGDINGDGFDDLIIGAHRADPNGSNSGASYVVFGKASGFAANLELSALDGTNGFQINGEAADDNSGFSVASAGDINGDGFADLIIGADGADPNGRESGASYVVFGKAAGFNPTLELSSLNGKNGFQINGEVAYDRSGVSVASAGDINGDGFDDLIIGATYADPNGLGSGASYVVFGKASGFGASLELSALNGKNGFQINGEAERDISGFSVASAGDINGDGFADLVIGAKYADPNGSYSGASYVVFGKASGFDPTLELSALNGSNGFQINGEGSFNRSGFSVASAGDVNGDGFADLIIGAYLADSNGSESGASYVVFGKASGWSTVELGSLDGNTGFKISGVALGDQSGRSVASAGDVNGDGFADLIIGADRADPNGSNSGSSYVIYGHRALTSVFIDGTALGQVSNGGFDVDLIKGNGGNDRLKGWEGNDILDGGVGSDTADYSDKTAAVSVTLNGATAVNVTVAGVIEDLIKNIENLIGGSAADTLTGDALANTLNGGKDALADILTGKAGNDIYIINSATDNIVELAGGGTADRAQVSVSFVLAAGDNIEFLETENAAAATALNLTGNEIAQTITGNAGANVINGGGGLDSMNGGNGSDTYFADLATDVVTETNAVLATGGNDLVNFSGSSGTFILGSNVERLTLLGTSAINGIGNALANTLIGNGAANTLDGLAGVDTADYGDKTAAVSVTLNGTVGVGVTVGGVLEDTIKNIENLIGGSAADTLTGDALANTLNGGKDALSDTLTGKAGDDIYIINSATDNIVELAGGGTADRAQASVSFVLAAGDNIEFLETVNAAATTALNLTGNEIAQTITGNAGANVINGGGGLDNMAGGNGSDTYFADLATDVVTETNAVLATGGDDLVNFSGTSGTFTLGTNVERLTLTGASAINGTGNALANTLIGNGAANVINGGGGLDSMNGGDGTDTYFADLATDVVTETNAVLATGGNDLVNFSGTSGTFTLGNNVERLTLLGTSAINGTGNALANTLIGNGAANTLNGGTDGLSDILTGKAGNDIYIINSASDNIVELAGGGTADRAQVSVSFVLAAGDNIEFLETVNAAATTALNLTGNEIAQTITGNAGANVINGGAGLDKMFGGNGSDTYFADLATDVVTETNAVLATGGNDLVNFTGTVGTFTLGLNVERLSLQGASAINGTGNGLANTLIGNGAANILNGKAGNDILTGGLGNDTFRFDTLLTANLDNITDFNVAADTLQLENAIFAALATTGVLAAAQFHDITTQVQDADDAILYNRTTGNLTYDSNGLAIGGQTVFAHVTPNTALTNLDFFVT